MTSASSVILLNEKSSAIANIENNNQYKFYQITIPAVNDRVFLFFMKFIITLKNDQKIEIPKLEQGRLVKSQELANSPAIPYCYFIKSFAVQLTSFQEWGYKAQEAIFKFYNIFTQYLTYLTGFAMCIFCIGSIFHKIKYKIFPKLNIVNLIIIVYLGTIVLARVIYYAVIDATLFPIDLNRHLFAANVLYLPLLTIILYKIISWITSWIRPS